MSSSPQQMKLTSRFTRFVIALVAFSLFAVACGGADTTRDDVAAGVEGIETNDGGVTVKPPDVLEGDDPADNAVDLSNLPPPVDGLQPTPEFDFAYFDGTTTSSASFLGRPTVVNFWASNCAPCVAEMPEFEEVHIELQDRVDFVGVNTADVSRESAVRLAAQTGVTYPLVDDSEGLIFRQFGGFAMPTTVLLNPQGQVAFTWTGVLNQDELVRLINEHILLSE